MEQQLRDQLNREIVNYMQNLEHYLLNLTNTPVIDLFATLHGLKGLLGAVMEAELQTAVHHAEQCLNLTALNAVSYQAEVEYLLRQLKQRYEGEATPVKMQPKISIAVTSHTKSEPEKFCSFELVEHFCQQFKLPNFICSVKISDDDNDDDKETPNSTHLLQLHPKAFSLLLQIIPHLVNNSQAHARLPQGQPLKTELYYHPLTAEFIYQDNGLPIDLENIRSKIKSFQFFSEKQINRLTAPELFNFMLMPGFTTTAHLDLSSGRGIGLTHIKKLFEAAGGQFTLRSRGESQISFHLKFPREWIKDDALAAFTISDDKKMSSAS